ncbi:MAG: hypothetical protein QNJ75_09160 [Acidimicrobiia bacterium]|nr:hypothetical protein [Acidimicrobiia bacterium]
MPSGTAPPRQATHKLILFVLVLLVASCSPSGVNEVMVPMPGDIASRDAAADIIRNRLDAIVVGRTEVSTTEAGLILEVPTGTSEEALDLVLAKGEITMRPVLRAVVDTESAVPGGGTIMAEEDGVSYEVGLPFVDSDDFVDGQVHVLDGRQHDGLLVYPTLTLSGRDAFVVATRTLAGHPPDDPRRQMVIALDDAVFSAPSVAEDVSPEEGLSADSIVLTIEPGPHATAMAHAIASYLRFGPLPVDLRLSE